MIKASPHGSMRDPILVKDVSPRMETKFLIESESVGLGMQLGLPKAKFAKAEEGGFDQDSTNTETTRIRKNRDALDLAGLIIDGSKTKRTSCVITDPCQQMFGLWIQIIEFRRMLDMLLNDEDGFPDSKCLTKHSLPFDERNGQVHQSALPGDTSSFVFRG